MSRIKYKDENGVWQYADRVIEEIVDVEAALAELIGGEENAEAGEVEGSGSE